MVTKRTNSRIHGASFLGGVSNLILLWGYVSVVGSSDIPATNSLIKLKLCFNSSLGTDGQNNSDVVSLPTLMVHSQTYAWKHFEIDDGEPLRVCATGNEPVLHTESTLTFAMFKEMRGPDEPIDHFIFATIRRSVMLFESGYLSIGDNGVRSNFYSPEEFCINEISNASFEPETTVKFSICEYAKDRPILKKCCPFGMILVNLTCIPDPQAYTWNPEYMDPQSLSILPLEKVNPVFEYVLVSCINVEYHDKDNCVFDMHPLTDNNIVYIGERRNWERWDMNQSICMDLELQGVHDNGTTKVAGKSYFCPAINATGDGTLATQKSTQYMITMFVGALFHLLTTIVYMITWFKQNIHGKTLCSCTLSLFFMQIFLGIAHYLGKPRRELLSICFHVGVAGHYFYIAAFTWLLIVNFDIWRTFRSVWVERGNNWKRLVIYSTFGWGLPFVIVLVSVSLDLVYRCRVSRVPVPDYGEAYCFVAPWTQGLYVYYIIGSEMVLSFGFAATLLRLYSIRRDVANYRSTMVMEDRQTILLFLKLGAVMGLSWIFEVIGWLVTKDADSDNISHAWVYIDSFNLLSSLLIFIIFVCKRTTFIMLRETLLFSKCKGAPGSMTNAMPLVHLDAKRKSLIGESIVTTPVIYRKHSTGKEVIKLEEQSV